MEKDPSIARKKRLVELHHNALSHNAYYFTDFMTAADAADVYGLAPESDFTVFGGAPDCERVMIRFGNLHEFGYEEDFPIVLLKIAPLAAKYADELTHRDFLGTLMGLGLERDVIGDIILRGENARQGESPEENDNALAAYVFVAERMADFIKENVTTVKHTTVAVEQLKQVPKDVAPVFEKEEPVVASLRLDGMVSKLYHLSREKSKAMFAKELVFINGRPTANPSIEPKSGDVISVRGHGKFIFDGVLRETKKGNTVIAVRRYA